MSFKDYDGRPSSPTRRAPSPQRRIAKREFLRRMALAGIGFSGFAAGLPRPDPAVRAA